MKKVDIKDYYLVKKEYHSLRNKYYSLKNKVIDNISKGYCIIPEKTLIELRDNYESKLVELLKNNDETVAKEKLKKEYDSIAKKYYINNISKEFEERSKKEITDLEELLNIYEATFDNSPIKETWLKVVGKSKAGKIITAIQLLNIVLATYEINSLPKSLMEILLMQYSKYQLDKNLYKKNLSNISTEEKINALKEGIEYLEKYFERKGIKVLA